jgi:hypothetical protein
VRTNYILIDFENVQPKSLEPLEDDHFRLLVFVGASQARLPFEIAASLQRLGPRAEYIKICGNSPNALDFHIAYYIGRLASSDPTAYFHIVSKYTGFDPLIQHLRSRKVLAERVKAITDIPLVKSSTSKSPREQLEVALARLRQLKASRPRTVKTLSSTIASLFQKPPSVAEVSDVVQGLVSQGYVAVDGTRVTYALPGDD